MVFKKQDLIKVCELTLTNSHCKKEGIDAEIQCLFLYIKDLEKFMGGGIQQNINLKINNESFEIKKLEFDEDKIILDFENELLVKNLELNTNLKINKIELYKRKFKGLLIVPDSAALGARMLIFVTTMYLASKTGFKFGFVWRGKIDKDKFGVTIESAKELLEEEFLKEHDYSDKFSELGPIYERPILENIVEITSKPYKKPWGYYVANFTIHGKEHEEWKKEFSNIFFNIPFRTPYKNSMLAAENIALRLGGFIAIHMRGGDIVDLLRYRISIFWRRLDWYFPVDLAIFTARHFIKQGKKVVLFSADKRASLAIKEYLSDKVLENNFFIASDFYEDFNEMQSIIFEVILMSKAAKIIRCNSAYSGFASCLGRTEPLHFNTYFDTKELYNAFIIPNLKDVINISSSQKAISCAYAYILAGKINVSFDEKIKLLNLALEFDINNSTFRVMILDEYFKQGYINRVENYLKNIINERCEEFISTIFAKYDNKHAIFQQQFDFYLKYTNEDFPYISFVAAKIAEFNKDFKEGLKYIDLSLQKEPSNEIFLQAYKTLETLANSAKARIHNHLAYKLGNAIIDNSKSLFGYIKMFYVLSCIRNKHLKEQKFYEEKIRNNPSLALPPLESYSDYKEALKEKQCFTYKLGSTFIKAYKTWYKGGLVKFYFEAKVLEREFKKNKINRNGS